MSEQSGIYIHRPGSLSRGAVLDVGLRCVHSCRFCYYSFLDGSSDQFAGMRRAKFRTTEECKEILRLLKERDFFNFDYTGGEPTLHPDIVEITRYAHQDLGLKGRMITLGQFLMQNMPGSGHDILLDALLEAGLTNFLFSVHAVDEELFKRTTGGSFEKLRRAMDHLDDRAFHYTSNTTVYEWNYQHLPAIARELIGRRVYLHNFIIMNAYYEWNKEGRAFGVQARYSDIYPYLREAVSILESNGVGVNIRYAPLCTLRGMERNLVGMIGVRYDPYEWMNLGGHKGGSPELCASVIPLREGEFESHLSHRPVRGQFDNGVQVTGARGDLKYFAEACLDCGAQPVCDGIDPNYLKIHGPGEFQPYHHPESGPIQAARLRYPLPFIVKTEQYADMKAVIGEEFAKLEGQAEKVAEPVMARSRDGAPAVSIIIPCYNYARYLPDCVGSIVNQTYKDFEIIIVNDGSPDDTKEVAEALIAAYPENRIRLINQPNSGQPAISRNNGIAASGGKYIVCLDADDMLFPTYLEKTIGLLEVEPGIAIAYTDTVRFGTINDKYHTLDWDFDLLCKRNLLNYCSPYRREVWEATGGYKTNVRGYEDWDFWIAAGEKGFRGKRIEDDLFLYRTKDGSLVTDALQRDEQLKAQIVLNHPQLYTEDTKERARGVIGRGNGVEIRHGESASAGGRGLPTSRTTDREAGQAGVSARLNPTVSVIVPTRDRPQMLREALMSLAEQTFKEFETVVINDAGADVDHILTEFSNLLTITYVKCFDNRERSSARNLGIKVSSGHYLAYLDDDDIYYPRHLETLVNALQSNRYKVAYTDSCRAIQELRGSEYSTVRREAYLSYDFDRDRFLRENLTPILNVMHERSCIDALGMFDESLEVLEDWELWIRLSREFDFLHVPTVTAEVRVRLDNSNTTSASADKFPPARQYIYNKHRRHYDDLGETRRGKDALTSIVILTHNQWKYTKACLASIKANTPEPYELIVVDNASTDGTVGFLRDYAKSHDNVRVMANRTNRGFAAGNNLGLALAKGDYVVLLNNDTIVTPGWLRRMLAVFERHPEAGIVGPMSNYVSGPQLVPDHEYRSEAELAEFAIKWANDHAGQSEATTRVVGFCLAARKKIIDEIGGLDERFGSGNFEDDDFCIRAAMAGFSARMSQDTFIHHHGSMTFTGARIDYRQSMQRNWELFKAKWWIPSSTSMDDGYRLPLELPAGTSLKVMLPELGSTHRRAAGGNWWEEADVSLRLLVNAESPSAIEGFLCGLAALKRPVAVTLAGNPGGDHLRHKAALPAGSVLESTDRGPLEALNGLLGSPSEEPIILVSTDVVLTSHAVDALLQALKRDPQLAAAGPVANQAPRAQRVKPKYSGTGKELRRAAEKRARDHASELSDAPYLGGFCILLNPRACKDVGLVRTDLDIATALWEYLARAKALGYKLGVAQDALVHHERLTVDEGAGYDDLATAEEEVRQLLGPGEAAMGRGDPESAEMEYRKVIGQCPDLTAGYSALASCLMTQERFAEAVPVLRQAIERTASVDLINELGVAQFQAGDTANAEIAFKTAREADASHVQSLLNLVELYRFQERWTESTQAVKQALSIDPNHPDVLIAFGSLSLELGDLEGGRIALERLRTTNPDHPACAALREAIEGAGTSPEPQGALVEVR